MKENERLKFYWEKPVKELVQPAPIVLSPGLVERHRLYSLCLMALVFDYWNGLKRGRGGRYPWNPAPGQGGARRLEEDYKGHNIAAFTVDATGQVIDFEFNHNKLLNSSAEHAEARVVRRIYSLNQIHDSWAVTTTTSAVKDDYSTFEEVTVYTSLESCSQCSGIMALARVKEVVFLQTDPGMYRIGDILRNLTSQTKLEAPRPVPASTFNFEYFTRLDQAYEEFSAEVATKPFWISADGSKKDNSDSITSFLCTLPAFTIYADASGEFFDYLKGSKALQYPDTLPVNRKGEIIANGLTNAALLPQLRNFFAYATTQAQRGTPH